MAGKAVRRHAAQRGKRDGILPAAHQPCGRTRQPGRDLIARLAILLAAGQSRRFGARNKLTTRIGGVRLIDRALATVRAAPARRVIVVTGHDHRTIAAAARGPRTTVVHARRHRDGMGASLAAALTQRRPGERQALLFLADMPLVPPGLAGLLLRRLRPGDRGVRPAWRGRPGHPVLLRLPLDTLPDGDEGPGRGQRLRTVPGPAGCAFDIDTPSAARRLANQVAVRALGTAGKRRECGWKT